MEENIRKENVLGTASISRLLVKFAVPSIISMLVNSIYNIVDQIFIGQGVGYLGNAATNVCFPFTTLILSFALLIGDGAVAAYSLFLGKKDLAGAQKAVGSALLMTTTASLLILMFGEVFLEGILQFFGATENVFPYARTYARITLIGAPFMSISILVSSIIRADGNPRYSMICNLTGAAVNVVLDAWFVFGLEWGIAGAAYATIIGQIINFVIAVAYIPKLKNVRIGRSAMVPDLKSMGGVLALGVSSFLNQITGTVVVIIMNKLLISCGGASAYGEDIPMAAFGIVMKVNQILMSFLIGMGVGAQPIVGYNYGARNYGRVRKTYRMSVVLATAIAVVGWLLFETCTQAIINIFGQENALYNEFALKCFRTYLSLVFLAGFCIVSGIFFQSIGKPVKATIVTMSRQLLFYIPAALLLAHFAGLEGLLYSQPVSDILTLLLTGTLVLAEVRLLKKQELAEMAALQPEQ